MACRAARQDRADLHDAVSFLKRCSTVDPRRIALCNHSFSGACALGLGYLI